MIIKSMDLHIRSLLGPAIEDIEDNNGAYKKLCRVREALGVDCTPYVYAGMFTAEQQNELHKAVESALAVDFIGVLQHLYEAFVVCDSDEHLITNNEFVVLDIILSLCEHHCPNSYKK